MVLAGSGAGAEALVSVAIGDRDWPVAIAELQASPGWFGMEGLSDPPQPGEEHQGPGLHVIVDAENGTAWQKEAAARAQVGAPLTVQILGEEDVASQVLLQQLIDALRR